jgi:hypothetical protein
MASFAVAEGFSISTYSTATDGEQIPRISPGSMTHVHAAFLHEAAIWRLGKIQQISLTVKYFLWWAVEGSNL